MGSPASASAASWGWSGTVPSRGDANLIRQALTAAGRKEIEPLAGLGIGKPAHVLDHTEHGHAHPLEHLGAAEGVADSHLLRRGHDERTGDMGGLHQRELGVSPVPGGRSTMK